MTILAFYFWNKIDEKQKNRQTLPHEMVEFFLATQTLFKAYKI